jgi:ElaB/YqjD/DUF883 family membrane-anchored ribosome-binding protein
MFQKGVGMDHLNHIEGFPDSQSNPDLELESGKDSAVNTIKDKLADGLKSAAASLAEREPRDPQMSGYVRQASRWLDNAGGYVEQANLSKVGDDLRRQVRANPGYSLLIAGALGLLVGKLFSRR